MNAAEVISPSVAPAAARAPDAWPAPLLCALPEPYTRPELASLRSGDVTADQCEHVLAHVARARGALDLAIGEGLDALRFGDRLVALGFSRLGDYAREVLGIRERTARNMAHLARELRSRPALREAVRAAEVCTRAAQVVLPVAVGDEEEGWVELARRETVRALEVAVRNEQVRRAEEEESWTRLVFGLSDEDRKIVDDAVAIAEKVRPGATQAQALEAMAQEYIAAYPEEAGVEDEPPPPVIRLEDVRRAHLEEETDRWAILPEAIAFRAPDAGVDAPPGGDDAGVARAIDAQLRSLAAIRDSWDGHLGFYAWTVQRSALWLMEGFASFGHYCEERLGMAARTVEQRAALEKRLWEVPALRAARDAGLSYEKLRALADLPDGEIAAWIPRARDLTCIALRRELERHGDAQMRAARVKVVRTPVRVAALLASAFRAVRAVESWKLSGGDCLVVLARHFIDTWKEHVKRARTRSQKVRERDLGWCQVPGCSRRADHAHHIIPRSKGGPDDDWNLVALCPVHHLRGVHAGFMRVSGRAPDQLTWVLGGEVWTGFASAATAPAAPRPR